MLFIARIKIVIIKKLFVKNIVFYGYRRKKKHYFEFRENTV